MRRSLRTLCRTRAGRRSGPAGGHLRHMMLAVATVVASAGAMAVGPADVASAATPPLTTPWTNQVSTTNPLPEYPRPQLTRTDWQSLNGRWQFAGSTQTDNPPTGQNLGQTVLVPYPIESALSGIQRHEDNMWYRRTFTVPSGWSGRHVQLNFGAVNWQAAVWVNGKRIGGHTGAYDPFSFDITSALTSGTNELIVGVWSPVDSAGIPVGKQRRTLGDIWYTASSGIWQSVWIEPTTDVHATRLDTTPDVAGSALDLVVRASGNTSVHAEVLSGGQVVGSADGSTGAHLRIPVPNARLWSPDDPFLYDLKVTLGSGDAVGGYFGLRSIGKALVGGVLRPVLNGRFVFHLGTLDQGYWPDGLYTAPTDEALKFDLQQQKNFGFNTVRKHIKVEPARWFYWADKLGLMVWQDMPSAWPRNASDRTNFESEMYRMVDQLRGITSIVQWQPFNEGWGEYDEARITDLVKSWDPTRLVDGNSGSSCCGRDPGNGDVIDDHRYEQNIVTNTPTSTRIATLGEFGGLKIGIAGHIFDPNRSLFGYEQVPDLPTLNRRYVEIIDTLQWLVIERGLSGAIYTQPYDVENEVNGLMTYDRQVTKVDANQIRAANQALINAASGYQHGDLISLGVTTPGYTDRYLRHRDGLASTAVISRGSDATSRQDATYWLRPGLANAACYSFESRNFPGQYLRHSNWRIRREADTGAPFAADATFCPRAGRTGNGIALESYNYPGSFLRHYNDAVYIASNGGGNAWDAPAAWADDTTWQFAQPLWRSGKTLPAGSAVSLQVTTPNYTDRYLRHSDNLGYTAVVTGSSEPVLKADATWYVVPGLADASCYSFKSRNFDGHYLRHSVFRLRKDADDGSALFDRDATFCAQPGRANSADVTLEAYNLAAHSVRHYGGNVWLATPGGPKEFDNAGSFDADSTWHVAAPWAP